MLAAVGGGCNAMRAVREREEAQRRGARSASTTDRQTDSQIAARGQTDGQPARQTFRNTARQTDGVRHRRHARTLTQQCDGANACKRTLLHARYPRGVAAATRSLSGTQKSNLAQRCAKDRRRSAAAEAVSRTYGEKGVRVRGR